MIIDFHALSQADKPLVDRYFHSRYYENAHFTFTNLFMWREPFQLQLAEEDGVLYMRCEAGGKVWFLQPFGPEEKFAESVQRVVDWCRENGHAVQFMGLEKAFATRLSELSDYSFVVEGNRDEEDYVYLAEQLATLSGRKYHQKRNFLHRFAEYGAVYTPLTERDFDDCITLAAQTYNDRLEGDLSGIAEQFAIDTFFRHFDALGLHGGVLRIDGRVIAFTIGEPLNSDTFCVHIEKADASIPGAFAAINQSFSAHIRDLGYTFINREEDMGLEGLRKAKESYHPCKMLEKRMVRFTL